MYCIDFVRGFLSSSLLLLLPAPGLAQNATQSFNRPVVVTAKPAQSISVHELSMPESARQLVNSGERKLSHDKNPQAAIKQFQSATKKAPEYYEAFYLTGVAYLCLGNINEAEKNFRQSIELSKQKYPEAVVALGTLLLDRGEIPGGERLLRHGLELNPHSWRAHYELGRLELSRGHLLAALELAQRARLEAPGKPAVFQLLAVIHQREANYPDLLDDLDGYLQLDSDSPTAIWAKELRAQTQQQLSTSNPDITASRK